MKAFSSLADLATHLAAVELGVIRTMHNTIEHGAKAIARRAKQKIGEYQEEVGEFAAWAELADSTKTDRVNQGFPENEPLLRTGEMRDSIEYICGSLEAQVGSNDDKAVDQELGTSRIPPRSFLGGAAAEIAPKIAEEAAIASYSTLISLNLNDWHKPVAISGE